MEKCGCKVKIQADTILNLVNIPACKIIFCPLHLAAGEMLEALEEVAEDFDTGFVAQHSASAERARGRQEIRIKAAILKAKGE